MLKGLASSSPSAMAISYKLKRCNNPTITVPKEVHSSFHLINIFFSFSACYRLHCEKLVVLYSMPARILRYIACLLTRFGQK